MFPLMAVMVFFMLRFLRKESMNQSFPSWSEDDTPRDLCPTWGWRRSSPSRSSRFTGGSLTSLKADANLYDLQAQPVLVLPGTDKTTGKPLPQGHHRPGRRSPRA